MGFKADDVVVRTGHDAISQKRGDEFKIVRINEFGWLVLPGRVDSWNPTDFTLKSEIPNDI